MLNNGKESLGLFLGYSSTNKAYRVFNKNSLKIEESTHVMFDEFNPQMLGKVPIFDDDVGSPIEASPKE